MDQFKGFKNRSIMCGDHVETQNYTFGGTKKGKCNMTSWMKGQN